MTGLDQLLNFARTAIDPAAEPTAVHSTPSGGKVLRVNTQRGAVIVKLHRSQERHQRELHAYRHWTTALGDRAPRLLVDHPDPPMMIVNALPGTTADLLHLSRAQQRDMHTQAGRLLNSLHAAEPPRPNTDIAPWLRDRGEQRLLLAASILPAAQRDETRSHLRALAELGPLPTVPCHLDFTPRNLLRDEHGVIRVIDFEHTRHDLAARDLVRLADRIWKGHPDLQEAFLDGYGPLSDVDREIIEHAAYLDHLTLAVPLNTGGMAPDLHGHDRTTVDIAEPTSSTPSGPR
jgi:Ser/Thr protein kinase RdoA (MazF antagonist)